MCYVMGYVRYCYMFVSDGMADDVLFVVIVAVKAFMVQLLSPRQSISYRIVSNRIESNRIVSYRIVFYTWTRSHIASSAIPGHSAAADNLIVSGSFPPSYPRTPF